MKIRSNARAFLVTGAIATLLVVALLFAPALFVTKAGSSKGLFQRTESHEPGLENYDIRSDKMSYDKLARFRDMTSRSAVAVADIRDNFVSAEQKLRLQVPNLKIEYNTDIRTPEVIAPDVSKGKAALTLASAESRSQILIDFLKGNNELVGASPNQIDDLKVFSDYTNPDGNLSFVELDQEINGIPVFRGEVKAGFSKNGEMVRVINNLAPGLDYESLSTDFGDAQAAVKAAAANINYQLKPADVTINQSQSNDLKSTFGGGDWATTAEKMYFPTEPGVAVPSWRVLIWEPVNAYYVIVDAQSGTMLWRKNITSDQTQSATYQVYTDPNGFINSADNPAPLTPGPVSPASGTQGTLITRNNIVRVGNEAPYTFNTLGWITDGSNVTDGNNLQAGIDRDGVNGVDAPQTGSPNRVFDSTWNPPPGNPAPGDNPLTAQAQRGAVIQMFYIMNLYHDELYRLGFTEQARNFQNDNFGRGGAGADRVSAEGQDSSGTDNANFSTPADGGRGRMQMYLWPGPIPTYDGTTDAEIIIHEVTHGTSNRLHGNSAGLSTNMSSGMGEGWGDFFAHAMLSEPSDPINGIYTEGGYATYLANTGYTSNYYYGIRRFPKAVMAFTGGPNNRPHNPLTFADADATQFNINDGAFVPGPFGSLTVDQVHNLGEIWSSALWEVRAKMVTRLGWAVGNRKVLQLVTDGMKLAPLGPTFLQERDAIIAAAQASSLTPQAGADVADVWAGFAIRGMGFSSRVDNPGSGNDDTRVTEAFDLPNLLQTPTFTVSDSSGDNDGFPEPGEVLTLSVPLSNNTGFDATGVTLQVAGGSTANYGTIANAQTVTRSVTYTVPANTACGSSINLSLNINSSLGATTFTPTIVVGVPSTTFTQNFDGITAPALPAGWSAVPVLNGINFVTTVSNSDSGTNSAFAADPTTIGGGSDLTSPSIPITASAATVSFRNRYNTEDGWDGGVLEISINGGAFQDIITAGGRFIENGYNGVLGNYNTANNPIGDRRAWTGNSGGYVNTTVQLPAAAAGQNIQLKWRFGADNNGAVVGWNIDTIKVNGSYACTLTVPTAKAPFDFDGDHKTDISIFRPSAGEWWYSRSSDAVVRAGQFGASTDVITPGDFTGDGKADLAFWRPSEGFWYILRSEDGSYFSFPFGTAGDIPMPADFDGDGKTDAAVFRPSTGTWFIPQSGGGGTIITQFGTSGDLPVSADYDGDGKADIAIIRRNAGNLEWWIQRSTSGLLATNFGFAADQAVPGDYTGDGKTDLAVWRPSNGNWFVLRSEDFTFFSFPFGQAGDIPTPGDYDGDGKFDSAVFRPSVATWFINRSGGAATLIAGFGLPTDQPVPSVFVR